MGAEIKNVGTHVEDLADGRMVGPGESVKVDEEALDDPYNTAKFEQGVFIRLDDLPKEQEGPDATDEAIKAAKKAQIDLGAVKGTGEKGRILVSDVERHIAEQEGAQQ